MTEVLHRVRQTIRTHGLVEPGIGIVIGVSGGPDSVCLLHVLVCLREELDLRLHVAHLHHGARGLEADADAEFVASLASSWELPVTVEKQDVPALARVHRLAFEETARRARYAFLARLAGEIGASRIAVGHNADDQAETVLMHFLRGAGLAGLRGMLPLTPLRDYRLLGPFWQHETGNGWRQSEVAKPDADTAPPDRAVIRPLLEVARSDIERYCADHGLRPRIDRSNLDTTFFRNHLRHDVLPLLERTTPNLRTRLCHTARVAAADYEVLTRLRDRAWADVVLEERATTILLDRVAWKGLPVAMQRATLRRAAYGLRRSLRDVSFVHVEQARQVGLRGETGSQATLPMGLVLTVGYDALTVGDTGDLGPPPDEPLMWSAEPVPVQVPGTTPLPLSEWVLRATLLGEWDQEAMATGRDRWTVHVDSSALIAPVALRSRRGGDRFHPRGMEGHSVKLSAFVVNRKVPRAWRDHIPLLVGGGEIVWVCGHRVAEVAAIGPGTLQVARMQFERAA